MSNPMDTWDFGTLQFNHKLALELQSEMTEAGMQSALVINKCMGSSCSVTLLAEPNEIPMLTRALRMVAST